VDDDRLRSLIDGIRDGTVAPDDAMAALRRLPFADLGHSKIDHHISLRQGMPEAVYAPGKSPEQCAEIVHELLEQGNGPVVLTRCDGAQIAKVTATNPGALHTGATLVWRPAPRRPDRVAICTAGTADGPVADECAATLHAHGVHARRIDDVGVAGLHRLLAVIDDVVAADAVVVVAGMEGALASVIGGLTAAPVVAVPTSVGYGAALDGVTALLAMHASCASGVTVVGIDNGFGAACAIVRLLGRAPRHG
jgi:pyridinium-3,5-biscarboxylic acid mononucleotide synthase